MLKILTNNLVKLVHACGYDLSRRLPTFPPDELAIMAQVRSFTMTSDTQLCGLIHAVRYVVQNHIEGDFVECGVWRGGSMMAMAYSLLALGETRPLHLFDTFEGMSAPTDQDVHPGGWRAQELLDAAKSKKTADIWAYASLEDVQRNMRSTGYPQEQLRYVKGKVEDTLPQKMPAKIALLRLDTDWYESTRHELIHLYPLLAPNGVLIIDDYGHWAGSRKATDEYFAGLKFQPFLNRLDYAGRLLVKPVA